MRVPLSPKRIFALAQDLSKSPEEERLRAAVGRAYYAVFLTARGKLRITSRSGVHSIVENEIMNKDWHVGILFKNLRQLREIADYQFPPDDMNFDNWTDNWIDAEDTANKILIAMRSWV